MVTALEEQGGEVVTGHHGHRPARVRRACPPSCSTRPREAFVAMAGDRVNEGYRRWVSRYHHGPGVFKIDWILSEPVPWTNPDVRRAGTIHVAGNLDETIAGERAPNQGQAHRHAPTCWPSSRPCPTPRRAPEGGHIFWAYVHVPHGSDVDMTEAIENQIERFAPGLPRHRRRARHQDRRRDGAVEPQLPRRRHLQRPGHAAADAGPAGAALEHLQDAGAGRLPRLGRDPARARPCTARAATTPRRWRCARCSASGRSRRCAPPRR